MKHSVHPEDFRCIIVETQAERRDHARVRYRSFADGREHAGRGSLLPMATDELDAAAETTLFTCYHRDEAVAAGRLIRPSDDLAAHHGVDVGLPLATRWHLRGRREAFAEPSQVCALPAFHGTLAIFLVIDALVQEGRRWGVDFLVGEVSTETDNRRHVEIQTRILAAAGLISRHHLQPRVVDVARGSARRALYTADEESRAARGDLSGLSLAPTLRFNALLGARFCTEPVRDPVSGVYSLAMLVRVAEVPVFVPPVPRAA